MMETNTPETRARELADTVAEWAGAHPEAGEVLFLLGRCHAALRGCADELEERDDAEAEPDLVVDARERIETAGHFVEALEAAVEAGEFAGILKVDDAGTAPGLDARLLSLLLNDDAQTKIRITVGAWPSAEEPAPDSGLPWDGKGGPNG